MSTPSSTRRATARLAFAALSVALSIVLGKVLSLTLGAFRISLENLPIFLAAIYLGPLSAAAVAIIADLLGCLLVGFSVNPIVTLGAAVLGYTAGVIYRKTNRLSPAIYSAHLLGSCLIKSLGLHLYYAYPWALLVWRLPLYAATATVELLILKLLLPHLKSRYS